jgi:hypothetical protein
MMGILPHFRSSDHRDLNPAPGGNVLLTMVRQALVRWSMRPWESLSRRPGQLPAKRAGQAVVAAKRGARLAGGRVRLRKTRSRSSGTLRVSGSIDRCTGLGSFGRAATQILRRPGRDRPEAESTMRMIPHFRRPDHRDLNQAEFPAGKLETLKISPSRDRTLGARFQGHSFAPR